MAEEAKQTTIPIDEVAAYYKRRMEAAENECLLLAARLRDQNEVIKKLIAAQQAAVEMVKNGATKAPAPKSKREKTPASPAGGEA